jgi:hypothetical protein
LALPESESNKVLQLVQDGRKLTAQRLLQNKELTLTKPILVDDSPKSIGMKVLSFPRRQVAVRDVADIIGHHYPVHVIDVEHQEELEGWTLADLVEYFEDEERSLVQHQQEFAEVARIPTQRSRRRRKAAEKCLTQTTLQRPRALNQISLEFSHTPLKDIILSPQFVRDLDWIDHAWPRIRTGSTMQSDPTDVYPNVQYYCLTSAAGCYTDFHIDFGGTAVWYHVMSGEKTFCLIPPTKENLAVYEDWLCRPDQADLFLPDMIPDPNLVIRVSLKASQTLVIPTAWIHAVHTPSDSVVLGGNFLHGLDMDLQLEIHCIESRTRVQEKFRFPFFLAVNFYAGGMYLDKLRRGKISQREVDGLGNLIHALEEWWKVQLGQSQIKTGPTVASAAQAAASKNNCETVGVFLSELKKEHARVVENGISPNKTLASSHPNKRKLHIKLPVGDAPTAPTPSTKLHIKLPVGDAPTAPTSSTKLHIKLPVGDAPTAPIPSPDGGKFRIVVSSTAVKLNAVPPRAKSKAVREDTDWYVDEQATNDDEEFMPSAREKQRVAASRKQAKRSAPAPQGEAKRPKLAVSAPRQPASTSARQRLMKRFR